METETGEVVRSRVTVRVISPSIPAFELQNVKVGTTVAELKTLISEHASTNIAATQQRLIYRGHPLLQPDQTLRDIFTQAFINSNEVITIHLVVPPSPSPNSQNSGSGQARASTTEPNGQGRNTFTAFLPAVPGMTHPLAGHASQNHAPASRPVTAQTPAIPAQTITGQPLGSPIFQAPSMRGDQAMTTPPSNIPGDLPATQTPHAAGVMPGQAFQLPLEVQQSMMQMQLMQHQIAAQIAAQGVPSQAPRSAGAGGSGSSSHNMNPHNNASDERGHEAQQGQQQQPPGQIFHHTMHFAMPENVNLHPAQVPTTGTGDAMPRTADNRSQTTSAESENRGIPNLQFMPPLRFWQQQAFGPQMAMQFGPVPPQRDQQIPVSPDPNGTTEASISQAPTSSPADIAQTQEPAKSVSSVQSSSREGAGMNPDNAEKMSKRSSRDLSTEESRPAQVHHPSVDVPAGTPMYAERIEAEGRSDGKKAYKEPRMIYLISSPQGPQALLVGPQGSYLSRLNDSNTYQVHNSSKLPATSAVPTASTIAKDQEMHTDTANSSGRDPQADHVARMRSLLAQTNPKASDNDHEQQPDHRRDQSEHQDPSSGTSGPQEPETNIIANFFRQIAAFGSHAWLLVRLFGFVWFFSHGASTERTMVLISLATLTFLIQSGIMTPLFLRAWNPLRQHIDRILPLTGPGLYPIPQAAAPARPADPAETNESNVQGVQSDMPTPEEMARRLLDQRRAQSVPSSILNGAERALALFIASLVPGVGERHVRAQEEANRRAEEEREKRTREQEENQRQQQERASTSESAAADAPKPEIDAPPGNSIPEAVEA